MAKLTDPDSLNQATEVVIATGAKTIQLLAAGNLSGASPGSTSGVTLQAVYSFLKEEWKDDSDLNKFKFPIKMFTKTDGQFINGWTFADATSRQLIRDAGFTEGANVYAGVISLGSFDASSDQAYYANDAGYTETGLNFNKTGNLNEAIDITGKLSYLKAFLRIEDKTFSEYDLLTEQGIAELEPVLYRLPLANSPDLKVEQTDAFIEANTPYTGMSIDYLKGELFVTATVTTYAIDDVVQDTAGRWAICTTGGTMDASGVADYTANGGTAVFAAYQGEFQIGAAYYAFNRVLDANTGTDIEAYEFLQHQLRETTDINDGILSQNNGLVVNGNVAARTGAYVGDQLVTGDGLFIDNLDANSQGSVTFKDVTVDGGGVDAVTWLPVTSTGRDFPFVATGTLVFSQNLVDETDADTRYTMYFTTNPGGNFDSATAIIVKDNSTTDISGLISSGSIAFDFDYDNNVQGGRTAGTDAGVTVVAQGLPGAEWVLVTATINATVGQQINVNAGDERNYANPV